MAAPRKPTPRPGILPRLVNRKDLPHFVERRNKRIPGVPAMEVLTDPAMHAGGMAVARRVDPKGKRVFELATTRRRDLRHELEHGGVIAFARDMGFPRIRTSSWLALMIEFSLPTRQKSFVERERVGRPTIRRLVNGGLTNANHIRFLHEYLSRLYPSAAAYRRALLVLMKNPALRVHLEALNGMDYGHSILGNYLHREEALKHITPITNHLMKRAAYASMKARHRKV